MSKLLTDTQLGAFERDGYLGPIKVMEEDEMADYRRLLEAIEVMPGGRDKLDLKANLLSPWLDDLTRHPVMLDVAEDLLGPDLLCWTGSFRFKPPQSPSHAGWHQDTMYIKVEPVYTFWLAFSPNTMESGCLEVIPGSHTWPLLPHRDTDDSSSILTRGQYITAEFDDSKTVHAELRPGEIGIFHHNIVHRSGPNRSDDARILYLASYMPTDAINHGPRDSAMLVRGVDRFGHFDEDPRPTGEMTPEVLEAHRLACLKQTATMYQGATREPVSLR
ncbi:MAG: phytanoyl-CoA dioxygenase family protein [Rhodospirillaceae bacterium]|jgi:non-haem Fe2+, alpha-ketoglutarate-dependent halogenase|nr:phytanoyl-CoA dioxygenase family protein [Rhodospirillaceae bacterium]